MLKTALKFGGLAAGMLILVMIAPMLFQSPEQIIRNMDWSEAIGYMTMAVSMILVILAIRTQRLKNPDAFGYGQAFATGMLTTLVASVLFGLATALLYLVMGKEGTDAFMRAYMEHKAGPDASPEQLSQVMQEYESQKAMWLNPGFQGFVMFATVFPMGLVVTAIAAWFQRRRA